MSLAVELLECPKCRAGQLRETEASVACGRCQSAFPVRDGIGAFMRDFDDYTDNYDQICADDLREPKTPGIVKEIFTRLVRERATGVTCDLGCGDGYVIRHVDAPRKVAVDIALEYLKRLPGSVTRLWSRIEHAPVRSGAFDTIICTDVIEHVQDVTPVRDRIVDALAPGGRALLAFPFEQDLSVYDLPAYKARFGKYKYVHLRSIDEAFVARTFPEFDVVFEHLITEGMALMEFKPYPIKFVELRRTR
ncbi:MAG: methyltransferase domain-containing protein [Candidatus Rokubacteria bacterium]|nr:methyltransferase domain-containing protein [Candidatus Rokubacteria bacterium]